MSEISDMTHVSSSSLSPYFYDLIDLLGVVEHRIPVMDNPEKAREDGIFLRIISSGSMVASYILCTAGIWQAIILPCWKRSGRNGRVTQARYSRT